MIINKKSVEVLYIEFILTIRPPNYILKIFNDDKFKERFFMQVPKFKKDLAKAGIFKNEYSHYFKYQNYRFKNEIFLPSLELLGNQKSIDMYLQIRKFLPKVINKSIRSEFNKQNIIDTKLLLKSKEVKENSFLIGEEQKINFIKRIGEDEILSFCFFSEYSFNRRSNFCKTCKQKIECKKRKR